MRIRTAIFETNFFNTYFFIALVLISAGWWENYVDEASFEFLGKMKSRLTQETKTSIYFISSPAKMIIMPKSVDIMSWIWSEGGTLAPSPHRKQSLSKVQSEDLKTVNFETDFETEPQKLIG